MLSAVRDTVTEPMLFDAKELELGQFPGVTRRVVINEHSPELARIGEANAQAHRDSPDPENSDAAQRDSDRLAHRYLVASILNCAITDIQLAMRQADPRTVTITHRRRVKQMPNEAFDSAVRFIFGQEEITVSDSMMRIRREHYSSFNAYCTLMGWSAPVFRGRILRVFPRLEWFVGVVLGEEISPAPVVRVRDTQA